MIQSLRESAKMETENLQEQAAKAAEKYVATLQAKDLKIQALILELAHLRRMRFGAKSEALAGSQQDLFEETRREDIAALEAQLEQQNPEPPAPDANKPI